MPYVRDSTYQLIDPRKHIVGVYHNIRFIFLTVASDHVRTTTTTLIITAPPAPIVEDLRTCVILGVRA